MTTFVDTSVLVSVTLGTEPDSPKAKKAIEDLDDEDPAVDTTIITETYLVLRSKVGTEAAAREASRILRLYAYFTVSKPVVTKALSLVGQVKFGDALIVEHARSMRARLLTLDGDQASLLGDRAILVR